MGIAGAAVVVSTGGVAGAEAGVTTPNNVWPGSSEVVLPDRIESLSPLSALPLLARPPGIKMLLLLLWTFSSMQSDSIEPARSTIGCGEGSWEEPPLRDGVETLS